MQSAPLLFGQKCILVHFFYKDCGKRKGLCKKHLCVYSKIGSSFCYDLLMLSKMNANDLTLVNLSKTQTPPDNNISPATIAALKVYVNKNTMTCPRSEKKKLSPFFRSWRYVVHKCYKNEHPTLEISFANFLKLKKIHFADIILFKKSNDACNICILFHEKELRYQYFHKLENCSIEQNRWSEKEYKEFTVIHKQHLRHAYSKYQLYFSNHFNDQNDYNRCHRNGRKLRGGDIWKSCISPLML